VFLYLQAPQNSFEFCKKRKKHTKIQKNFANFITLKIIEFLYATDDIVTNKQTQKPPQILFLKTIQS